MKRRSSSNNIFSHTKHKIKNILSKNKRPMIQRLNSQKSIPGTRIKLSPGNGLDQIASESVKCQHYFILLNSEQESEFFQASQWWQKPTLPVIRLQCWKMESKPSYPKYVQIDTQEIVISSEEIELLGLGQSIYILRQLLGALILFCKKLKGFDLSKVFYGLNAKGECKVWPSQNRAKHSYFSQSKPTQMSMLSFCINRTLKMVKTCYRRFVLNLYSTVLKEVEELSLSHFLLKMAAFVKERKINIPLNLKTQTKRLLKCCSHSKLSAAKNWNNKKDHFQFPNKNHQNRAIIRQTEKMPASVRTSISNKQSFLKKMVHSYSTNNLFLADQSSKDHDSSERLMINSHDYFIQSRFFSNKIPLQVSFGKNHSLATTHLSENFNISKEYFSSDKLSEYKESSSLMIESRRKISHIKSLDNILALDPVPEDQIRLSNEEEGKYSESAISFTLYPQRGNQPAIEDSMDQFWGKKLVNVFANHPDELKVSVHCGEEQPVPLEVKLQKLGKLGRDVNRSFCPTSERKNVFQHQ